LAGIPIRVGEDVRGRGFLFTTKVPYQREVHETDGTNNLLHAMGIDVKERWPSLNIKDDEMTAADEFLSSNGVNGGDLLIGLHAGSGFKQTFKRWPKERFGQLADQLVDQHKARIIFTGGSQERDLIQEIQALMRHQTVNAGGALSIRKTAALIKKCHLFVSNDSGLAHVSAAVQTPSIVLFGDTELHRIAPRGEKVHILRKEMPRPGSVVNENSIMHISVDDVVEAAQQCIAAEETK
jgi:ADP-heptose:LPS heptosyltransferase